MRLLVLLCLFSSFTLLLASDAKWSAFKSNFNKKYSSKTEETLRRLYMNNASRMIDEYNRLADRGAITYRLAINKHADLSEDEFNRYMKGFIMSKENDEKRTGSFRNRFNLSATAIPASVDWRKEGLVTSVKNQGQCGSCWAFACVGALEGQYLKKRGNRRASSLSSQQFIDCDYRNYGCNGGDFATALRYSSESDGITYETNYPYYGYKATCRFDQKNIAYDPSAFKLIYNEADLKYALATVGPVAIAMYSSAPSFRYYRSGIYDDVNYCYKNNGADHAMVAVGYGTENGVDFWIVKNSWGPNWGENGYIRIRRGRYTCGIGRYSGYPY